MVQLAGTGPVHGRFSPGFVPKKLDFPMSAALSSVFCTLGASKCKCPDGSPKAGTSFQVIEPGGSKAAFVALTGGSSEASVTLSGTSLQDFCGSKPPRRTKGVVPRDCPWRVGDRACRGRYFQRQDRPGLGPGRWEYEGEVLPPKYGVTCGYHEWTIRTFPQPVGPDVPVALAQVAVYLDAEAQAMPSGTVTAQVPGADQAWFEGGALKAVVGGRTLGVSLSVLGDPEEASIAIGTAILGTG